LPRLRFTRRAREQFLDLSPGARRTLDEALLRLQLDPEAAGIPLVGALRGTWRLREGGYRVLYRIRDDGRVVVVESIRRRPEAYGPPH
jgi:mRNA-degrading endonuclease RelE of RelBE toxin-antitoxin system